MQAIAAEGDDHTCRGEASGKRSGIYVILLLLPAGQSMVWRW